ncbi:CpsD/CapB family tyrosine-protein kinase [Listeria aquatica]|uniref:non-specific protein-tyrosine kinase n=1 Tax=Listeria aquatica TaxID=1494960 RepID=A0A841ZLA0_9LIST|nr:CpsD/CapB family tyrosine-protein kinase [Listeria aquatica]
MKTRSRSEEEKVTNSFVQEKLSEVHTNIQFMKKKENKIRTMAITSANKGEGKTFFSSNFAQVYSEFKEKTLLVDTDFYSPKLSKQYKKINERGFSDLLIGEINLTEAVHEIEPYLDFLSIGTIPPNPVELLKTHDITDVIREGLKHYEMILFDCPPVNLFTNARLTAAACDLSLLIVKKDSTKEEELRGAKTLLTKANVDLVGVVLNQVNYKEKNYNYYKY